MLNKSRKRKQSKLRTKRNKRRLRRTKRKGGQAQPQLSINYANIRIGGQELGRDVYLKPPRITITNYAADFIITMTDPDAPAGTWTHYVALIKPDGSVADNKPYYAYQPPKPPPGTGIHHYIFKAYPLAKTSLANNRNLPGNEYYKQVLLPFIENNKPLAEEKEFTVTS